jgi:glycine/D-amino acid oxidase-like deaminating enzyme/nitrite reductase/ring-hydroxylating ferredoxin subunit
MESVWNATCRLAEREPLPGDIRVDAAVVGAGMAGVLTACLLQEKGLKVAVVEAGRTAGGVTGNTPAKITAQHGVIYRDLIKRLGREKAEQYAQANGLAVQKFREMILGKGIDCEFEERPACVYSREDAKSLEEEAEAARSLGLPAGFTEKTTLPFPVRGAVTFQGQAQFHPLKFLTPVANRLAIYEGTAAKSIEGKTLYTDRGEVTADAIVIATHFPFIDAPGYYFMRMHQEHSYVIALEGAARLDGMYIGAEEEIYSFRNYGGLLLLGGSGHRTGKNRKGGAYARLRDKAVERYHWSAQDCMTPDGIPYIGQYAGSTPGIYVATGFNKWGMTGSMAAAMLLSDDICGKKNDFAEVFSPRRLNVTASARNLMTDGAQAVGGLLKEAFKIPGKVLEEIRPGQGGIVEHEGKKIGVYRDPGGKSHLVTTRCPHLGCQLEWNPDELSWDCPCHGSRFDYKGNLLNNPAMEGISLD